jgi:hypothetical protein
MSISTKYGRTYHYPFSPGTTSDDRIQYDYWSCMKQIPAIVHTEKLDGENNCLSKYGVFARSHAAPTTSPWTKQIRRQLELLKRDLGELELFGENLYAIHSIRYKELEHHFYLFAVRYLDTWLSWEEVKWYAAAFDFPHVPELQLVNPAIGEPAYKQTVLDLVAQESRLKSYDAIDGTCCTMEGIVSRNTGGYAVSDFACNVFKYVRKGHVKTDEHWTRNWKRAPLRWEKQE